MAERVKFNAPNPDLLVWKWPSDDLKLGSQVVVNQSQDAVFVKGGRALDVFGPGTHTLETGNLPLLGRLVKWTFGQATPFTAEVWFINKTVRRGLKWGTRGPIQIIDPVYHFPVGVRAFGEWGMRVVDAQSFVNQIVGSQMGADAQLVEEYFAGEIIQRASNMLAEYITKNNISIFKISAYLNELSENIQSQIVPEFERFGIEIVNFNVSRISIPDEDVKKIQDVLGKKMEVEQLSDVNVSSAYAAVKNFEILGDAARNSSNGMGALLGAGIGLGAGVPMGRQMAESASDAGGGDAMQKLQKLKQMLDAGLITENDFDAKKQEILSKI